MCNLFIVKPSQNHTMLQVKESSKLLESSVGMLIKLVNGWELLVH